MLDQLDETTEKYVSPTGLRVRADLYDEDYSDEDYEAMLSMYEGTMSQIVEGEIVKSKVLRVTDNAVILDVGFKSEGSVPLDEFKDPQSLQEGDEVEVFLEHLEDQEGADRGLTSPLLLGSDVILDGAERRQLTLRSAGNEFVPWMGGRSIEGEIRTGPVTSYVSPLSATPEIRDWVNARLRAIVNEGRDVVVDGRDIGSVVFPDADLKVFLTASPEVRARRRISQRGLVVGPTLLAREIAAIAARDAADSTRAVAPLRRAADAIELDTTDLSFEDQVARIVGLVASP
jgi:cytidylate kinase